jgi:hypothetical protein
VICAISPGIGDTIWSTDTFSPACRTLGSILCLLACRTVSYDLPCRTYRPCTLGLVSLAISLSFENSTWAIRWWTLINSAAMLVDWVPCSMMSTSGIVSPSVVPFRLKLVVVGSSSHSTHSSVRSCASVVLTGASFSLSDTNDCQSLSSRHCRLRDDEVAVIVVVDVSLGAHRGKFSACCFVGALPPAVILVVAGLLHSSGFGLPPNGFLSTGHLIILSSPILRRRPCGRSNALPFLSLVFWLLGLLMCTPRPLLYIGTACAI